MNGKGSKRRPTNQLQFNQNYSKINWNSKQNDTTKRKDMSKSQLIKSTNREKPVDEKTS